MGLIECASGNSVWRGYDYYKEKRVSRLIRTDDTVYSATVAGSDSNAYAVTIDATHPRKSKCNCPHADGKQIICKHMVAVYFTAFPKEAERIYNEAMAYEEEEEKRQEELSDKLVTYIGKMKKDDLQGALLQVLFDGPEWQYDKFIREYMGIW